MRILYSWLKDYLPLEDSPEKLADRLTMLGMEVEGIEYTFRFPEFLKSQSELVVGQILSFRPHENADKLSLVEVDVAKEKNLSIVCGASNLCVGKKVIVAQVGTYLNPEFQIVKRNIRGVESEGMLCSEQELGIGNHAEGILLLDTDDPVGTQATDSLSKLQDSIFELAITPNRGDVLSHLGVARDLQTQYTDLSLNYPDFLNSIRLKALSMDIIQEADLCSHYGIFEIQDISIGPSPAWVQARLRAMGVVPVNNVVDATNYVLFAVGQPLHAFDADKIVGDQIQINHYPEQTPFRTLDGKDRRLSSQDIVIADAEKPLALAGVMGGEETCLRADTRRVLLEAAVFSSTHIRRSSSLHNLSTDASYRYERGLDPSICYWAGTWAAYLSASWTRSPKKLSLGFAQVSVGEQKIGEENTQKIVSFPSVPIPDYIRLSFSPKSFNSLMGLSLGNEEIAALMKRLGIKISADAVLEKDWELEVPSYRIGVNSFVDVAEELLRIYGYDKVKEMPEDGYGMGEEEEQTSGKERVSSELVAWGFYEMVNSSLIPENKEDKISLRVLDPMSSDWSMLRSEGLSSGLNTLYHNISHKCRDLFLFEWGRTYHKEEGKFSERENLFLFMTGQKNKLSWRSSAREVNFYDLSEVVGDLLKRTGIHFRVQPLSHPLLSYGANWTDNTGKIQAWGGCISQVILEKMGLDPQAIFYASISADVLLYPPKQSIQYREISKYPIVRRDLSLVIDQSLPYSEIEDLLTSVKHPLVSIDLLSVYEGENLPDGKKSYALSLCFHAAHALSDKEIHQITEDIFSQCERDLNALIRRE
ncbi:MAG: phenylalanine--tRNA ligase subunit beta [Cytophagales bacterium]|nr:phenylalanine--tRNA ligase subunit beta [Cytophagales bacterium]